MEKTNIIDKDNKLLVIVESPNKRSSVSSIMKALGYKNVTVVATVGHTTKIKDDKKSYKNTGIYPKDNFRVVYEVDEGKKKVVADILELSKKADHILIASDPDREGECIGYHIKELLKLKDSKYSRITYHSVTKEAIKEALEHPRKIDADLCNAAEARSVIDKLVGYSLSPIAKIYVGAKSVGRCQSAGLKLVVDRENEINNFVPEQYFDLYLDFKKEKKDFRAKYTGTVKKSLEHIKTKKEADKVISECNGDYIVTSITSKERQESPKPPFCTATFQQEASSKLGLKVEDAMKCAQELFEGITVGGNHVGLITYHRTDDTDLAEDFKPVLKEFVSSAYGSKAYTEPRKGKKSENDQEGHEALRCVDPNMTPEKLEQYVKNTLLLKVYKLIWQRTIASAMPNAIIAETTYTIENNGHKFNMTSSVLASPGYRSVYSYIDEDDAKENIINIVLKEGEKLNNTKLNLEEKSTKPKPRYTDATLVKELQKRGIGRPSTYATIISTILNASRNYCTLDGKYIVPTVKGIELVGFLDRAFSNIINLDYTKEMEKSLDLIATGKETEMSILTNFFNTLETAINNNTEVGMANNDEEQICPECGNKLAVRRGKYGLFYGCTNYPRCHFIKKFK